MKVLVTRKVRIFRFDLYKRATARKVDFVAEDYPLSLFVNATCIATFMCTPQHLDAFAVGHLLSEGILRSVSEIDEVRLKPEEHKCIVKTLPSAKVEAHLNLSRLRARIVSSACGGQLQVQPPPHLPQVASSLKVNAETLYRAVNELNFKAEVFRQTGGTHVAAIYRSDGTNLALAEDVGRHNAVDKVVGMAALAQIDFNDCFLVLSGRLSGDIVAKAARVGVPIVASLAAALSSGIVAAKATRLTLVGFVRGKRLNVYTCEERILS
jgi:formate dehydrogenase accessory protein FdhD